MAQFGSQDVAAMTNHHLSFFLSFFFCNVLFNRGQSTRQSHKLRYNNKKKNERSNGELDSTFDSF
jgi:hypothetical protein